MKNDIINQKCHNIHNLIFNYFHVKILYFIIIPLIIGLLLILIPACNKDTTSSDIQLAGRNTPNSGNQSFVNKINFDNNGNILIGSGHLQKVLEHAQIEKQREVSEYIFEHLSFNSIDSIKKIRISGLEIGYN